MIKKVVIVALFAVSAVQAVRVAVNILDPVTLQDIGSGEFAFDARDAAHLNARIQRGGALFPGLVTVHTLQPQGAAILKMILNRPFTATDFALLAPNDRIDVI